MTRFVLISGNGRSGSNRLLDILDRSSETACRNEMNGVVNGHFDNIGGMLFAEDMTPERIAKLEHAVAQAGMRRSDRDRPPKARKTYFRPHLISDAMHWATSKDRLRFALARTPILAAHNEWDLPGWYTDRTKLRSALSVLKLNAGPAWTLHLHNTDPEGRIIHNIRHPRDYLNSWYNRFAKDQDHAYFETYWSDVPRFFEHFGKGDPDYLHDFSKESVMEIELWRWRYTNETLHEGLKGSERAMTITYADIDDDPGAAAQQVYAFAGLPYNDQVAELVQTMRNTLFAKKHTVKLEDDLIDRLVDKVMDGSSLRDIPNLF